MFENLVPMKFKIRLHNKKMSIQSAIRELKSCAGTQFDSELTEEFIEFIS